MKKQGLELDRVFGDGVLRGSDVKARSKALVEAFKDVGGVDGWPTSNCERLVINLEGDGLGVEHPSMRTLCRSVPDRVGNGRSEFVSR